MKTFLNKIWNILEEISAARAQSRIKYGWY
jgi:hypothetical protein